MKCGLRGRREREPILGVRIPLEENIEIIGQFAKGGVTIKASPHRRRTDNPGEQTKKAAETVSGEREAGYCVPRRCQKLSEFEIAEILKSPTVLFHRRRLRISERIRNGKYSAA